MRGTFYFGHQRSAPQRPNHYQKQTDSQEAASKSDVAAPAPMPRCSGVEGVAETAYMGFRAKQAAQTYAAKLERRERIKAALDAWTRAKAASEEARAAWEEVIDRGLRGEEVTEELRTAQLKDLRSRHLMRLARQAEQQVYSM